MSKHTPGPWHLGEWDENLGYDCMTSGICCGPAVLDGRDYFESYTEPLTPGAKEQMLADARLIAAAPELLDALQRIVKYDTNNDNKLARIARAAIAKATHDA